MGFWRSSHTAESSWTWISPLLFSLKFCQCQASHAWFGEEILCLDFWFHLHQGQFLQRVNNDRAIHSQCAILLCKIGRPFPFYYCTFCDFYLGLSKPSGSSCSFTFIQHGRSFIFPKNGPKATNSWLRSAVFKFSDWQRSFRPSSHQTTDRVWGECRRISRPQFISPIFQR